MQAEVLHKEFLRVMDLMDAQVTEMRDEEGEKGEENREGGGDRSNDSSTPGTGGSSNRAQVDELGRAKVVSEAEMLRRLIFYKPT